ncbi:MAG: Protein of unknown function (DUF1587)/Protein of unknown function (DUF1592)/Protein of unknown [Verrucomicrobiales bacterium]|nr:Protein of unknown function (DUF1587)/Protein of unknown function (DUF1592)/Protein of unknown [Verrucomicrobiales bacterium]
MATSAKAEDARFEKTATLVHKYCSNCHLDKKAKGGVSFNAFTNALSIYNDLTLWEKVTEQLNSQAMPPEGKPPPLPEEKETILVWINKSFSDLEEGRLPKDPGHQVIHRLSRLEYDNTIRDLFGKDLHLSYSFPADGGGGGGFDNNASTLFVPPILLERYLEAAQKAVQAASSNHFNRPVTRLLTSEKSATRKKIEELLIRIYRHPPEREQLESVERAFNEARKSGSSYEDAFREVTTALLASPNFIFRVEQNRAETKPYPVSDYDLASRLSYFLWASMPDQRLFELAQKNKLHDPATLDKEVLRMLQDPKSKSFLENFVTQWLRVGELKTTAQPDLGKYPTYKPKLRDAMYQEVVLFFDDLVRSNRSLLNVLDSDYAFLNQTLASHYGIQGVDGDELQKVTLPSKERGGVLGMGAILVVTSYPQRTSPVLRGKWVLEEILGTPPPPPPPLVPGLSTDDHTSKEGLTFRQRLEKHREKAECAGCHKKMDPLGFGLENFDGIGQWRTKIGAESVDAKGILPDGKAFEGPAQLRHILLDQKQQFIRNLTEKMLAYALGRGLDYHDIPTVRQICRKLESQNYSSHVLIAEIVKSYPFQFRQNETSESGRQVAEITK